MAAEREIGLEAQLERREAQRLEPADLVLGERLVLEVGERRAPPERECLAKHIVRLPGRTRGEQLPALVEQTLEPLQVESTRLEPEPVPRRPRLDDRLAEQLTQLRDVHLHGLDGGRRRLLAPELVDEPRRRHDLVRPQQEHGEQRPLLRTTERKLTAIVPGRDRTKNPELQGTERITRNKEYKARRGAAASPILCRPSGRAVTGAAFAPEQSIARRDHEEREEPMFGITSSRLAALVAVGCALVVAPQALASRAFTPAKRP